MKSLINNLSASPVTAEDINALGIEEIDDPELTETLKAEAVMRNIKRMQDYKTPLLVFDEKEPRY